MSITGEQDLQRVSAIYPAPTLDAFGRPVGWQPTSTVSEIWGRYQIVFNDVDVTFFRGFAALLGDLVDNEPFGNEQLDVNFPQISPFDVPGLDDLYWLVAGCSVELWHVFNDGTIDYDNPLFEGRFTSTELTLGERTSGTGSGGQQGTELPAYYLTAHCIGALYAADLQVKTPAFVLKVDTDPTTGSLRAFPEDVGKLISGELNDRSQAGDTDHAKTVQLAYCDPVVTGVTVSDPGSGTQLVNGYFQDLLAQASISPDPQPGTLVVGLAVRPDDGGYWVTADDPSGALLGNNSVIVFGPRTFFGGSMLGVNDPSPISAMEPTPTGLGYWLVAREGDVHHFGDAGLFGSYAGTPSTSPVIAMARTTDGLGYWLLQQDGTVHAFGDATHYGDASGTCVGICRSTGGSGYVVLEKDGTIRAFGDASFYSNCSSAWDFVAIDRWPGPGDGYTACTVVGELFTRGSATSPGPLTPFRTGPEDVVAFRYDSTGAGYWLATDEGHVYNLGDAPFWGSVVEGNGQWESWTLAKNPGRVPVIRLKDRWTVHATIRVGQPGVHLQTLLKDPTTSRNVVYGEGTDTQGNQWRNARYPNLRSFDFGTWSVLLKLGVTDSSVLVWAQAMHDAGWAVTLGSETFTGADRIACMAFQAANGLDVTGQVDAATWNAMLGTGINNGDLTGAYVAPLSEATAVEPQLYDATGAVLSANPKFDPTALRVEGWETFGTGVDLSTARESAKSELLRDYPAGWLGTIVLMADPNEMSRYDLRAGMNLLLQGLQGADSFLHIAQVSTGWGTAGRPVTLTVDEHAEDLVTVAAMRTMDRSTTDPVRRTRHNRRASRITNDRGTTFDVAAGAGRFPQIALNAGVWSVVRMAAGAAGTITEVSAATTGPACTFALGIFQTLITQDQLDSVLPNPFENPGTGGSAWDNFPTNLGLVIGWGQYQDACGYSPLTEAISGAPVTGVLTDQGSWQFQSLIPPWLWLAVFATEDCIFSGAMYPQPID